MVMFALFEPKRPKNYQDLPCYQREGYWQAMDRAVTVRSKNLVEIRRYFDQRLRVVTLILAVFTLALNIAAPINSFGSWEAFIEKVEDDYNYVFNFEEVMRLQYQTTWEAMRQKYTEQEYVDGFLTSKIHSNRFFRRLFLLMLFWSVPLILLLIAAFLPRGCPVRFDRKREIVYTWDKGHFYIADIGPYLGGMKDRITTEADGSPIYFDTSNGAFGIEMARADGIGSAKLFRVGTYPVCHAHQNKDIQMFVRAFMSKYLYDTNGNKQDWNGDWLDKIQHGRFFPLDPLRWLGSKTLGRKHRFDDNKTETVIMTYLTDPKTRDRGQPVWRRKI